jgi:hypothetical protein
VKSVHDCESGASTSTLNSFGTEIKHRELHFAVRPILEQNIEISTV